MPKTKQQKQEAVKILTDGLKQAKGVVFANFQGLTVAESEELRRECRKENIEVVAAKKTLVKRALDGAGLKDVNSDAFQGGVATFMGSGDEISPAKVVCKFARAHEIMSVFGGILDGKFMDAVSVKNLSLLPGRQELLSKLVGTLNSPISGFVNVCAGTIRGLFNVLNNIQKA